MSRLGSVSNASFFIAVGTLAFVFFILSGFRYVIKDGKLSIKLWFLPSGSFPVSQIISIERSYNVLSSAGASIKRLRVNFQKGYKWPFLLISPAQEQEFLDAIKELNPDIYFRVDNKKGWWRIWDWDI